MRAVALALLFVGVLGYLSPSFRDFLPFHFPLADRDAQALGGFFVFGGVVILVFARGR
jgi:hypothetical protein